MILFQREEAESMTMDRRSNDQQKLRAASEMARLPGKSCAGCGNCCRGMGDTIVLDPWDAAQLSEGLGRPFASMLEREVDLHAEEGLILPHLRMQEETDACAFLQTDGKCAVHPFRPGICRLFPLGRQFGEGQVRYFFPESECPSAGRVKTQISRWLEIPGGAAGLKRYEAYKLQWHDFTARMKDILAAAAQEEAEEGTDGSERVRQINVLFLQQIYMRPYSLESFYDSFEERSKRISELFYVK